MTDATPPRELTDAEIVAIRDQHLPSQGEAFDCIAFARAILRAADETNGPGREPVAWRWRPKGAEVWIYDPSREWMELQGDAIEKQPLYAALPVPPANRDAEPVTCWRYLHGHAHCPDAAPPAAPLPAADADAAKMVSDWLTHAKSCGRGIQEMVRVEGAEIIMTGLLAQVECNRIDLNDARGTIRRQRERIERQARELAAARAAIVAADGMRQGHDCPMCDNGKLRNPAKEHWDNCAFANYDRLRAARGKP